MRPRYRIYDYKNKKYSEDGYINQQGLSSKPKELGRAELSTSITDYKGNEIYRNDILENVITNEIRGVVDFDESLLQWCIDDGYTTKPLCSIYSSSRIIGNTHNMTNSLFLKKKYILEDLNLFTDIKVDKELILTKEIKEEIVEVLNLKFNLDEFKTLDEAVTYIASMEENL